MGKDAEDFCNAVLTRTENNAKARYRRGLARAELGNLLGAIEDLRCAVAADGNGDASIRRELARVEKMQRERLAEERSAFSGVFAKMRKEDDAKEQREEAKRKAEEERLAKIKAEEDKA